MTEKTKSPIKVAGLVLIGIAALAGIALGGYYLWSAYNKPAPAVTPTPDTSVSDVLVTRQKLTVKDSNICLATEYWDYDANGCRVITNRGKAGTLGTISFPSNMTTWGIDNFGFMYWTANSAGTTNTVDLFRTNLLSPVKQRVFVGLDRSTQIVVNKDTVYLLEPVKSLDIPDAGAFKVSSLVVNGTTFSRSPKLSISLPGEFYKFADARFTVIGNNTIFVAIGDTLYVGCNCLNKMNYIPIKLSSKILSLLPSTTGGLGMVMNSDFSAGEQYIYQVRSFETGELTKLAPAIQTAPIATGESETISTYPNGNLATHVINRQNPNTTNSLLIRSSKNALVEYDFSAFASFVTFHGYMDGGSMVLIFDGKALQDPYIAIVTPQGQMKYFALKARIVGIYNGVIYYRIPSAVVGVDNIGQIVTNQSSTVRKPVQLPPDLLTNK